jgi:DNA-binding NarL/FixJ family response regulator
MPSPTVACLPAATHPSAATSPPSAPPQAAAAGRADADSETRAAVAALLDRNRWREHVEQVATLSRRELAILLQLGSGASNCTIARRLRITERTVKAHIGQILSKLRLESRLQAGLVGYLWAQSAQPSG